MKDKMEELTKLLHKLQFDYYQHGSRTDTIALDDDIKPILEYIKNNFVRSNPKGFKVFAYDAIGGWNGEREYLQKFATQVSIVKDFHGKDKIVVVVPRGIDEQVDKFIKEQD